MTIENNDNFDITLVFDEKYESFGEFYISTREKIFRELLFLFELISSKENHEASICVSATINDVSFSTNLTYNLSNVYLISEVILPYFEEKEDFETCSEIVKLMNKLKINQ